MSQDLRLLVQGLHTRLQHDGRETALVRGVDLRLHAGETLALVGESGSGKSLTALTLMRLLARDARWSWDGQAELVDADGQHHDLLRLPEAQIRRLRGHQMAMIFQEPMSCLNPVLTVGQQIAESVRLHLGLSPAAARQRALQALEEVESAAARCSSMGNR